MHMMTENDKVLILRWYVSISSCNQQELVVVLLLLMACCRV